MSLSQCDLQTPKQKQYFEPLQAFKHECKTSKFEPAELTAQQFALQPSPYLSKTNVLDKHGR